MVAFRNYTVSVYSRGVSIVDGSEVQTKTIKYSNIPAGVWKGKASFGASQSASEQNSQELEVNLAPEYSVIQGDIIEIESQWYQVAQVIAHNKANGMLDNFEIRVKKTDYD